MKNIAIALVVLFTTISCSNTSDVDVSSIRVDSELVRFDSLFYNSDSSNIESLKDKFPLLLPAETNDTIWYNKIEDKENQDVYKASVEVFGDFSKEHSEIIDALRHFKYYFPKFQSPDVYTILSDFDYKYSVLYADNKLFVSLDMYLGSDREEYESFPKYMVKNFTPSRIKVDVVDAISKTVVSRDRYDRSLLSQMIYNGKLLYLSQKAMPKANDSLLIGYTEEEIEWCKNNEFYIWTYIIKNKLVYDTNPKLTQRFIDIAPFTKFYLDLDRESPGRVGVWLGWQIVNSYMDNNDVTLEELISNNDSKEIFRKSKYKPGK